MANFLVVRDPDPVRRQAMLRRVEPALAPFAGLRVGALDCSSVAVRWAVAPEAPESTASGPQGAAVIWGDARRAGTAAPVKASELLEAGVSAQYDGYHALLRMDDRAGLEVAADLFGFFPVYYWTDGDVALIGASPHLFRWHPRFHVQLSREGLAGILLAQTIVHNQPLLAGVRRLAAGHRMHLPLHGPAAEHHVYRLRWHDAHHDLGLTDHVALLGEALEAAIARATPAGDGWSMLLSGGLDSRVLLGANMRLGRHPSAITFGRRGDLEARCATAAARVARVPHRLLDDTPTNPEEAARRKIAWEQLAGGFWSAASWSTPPLAGVAAPLLNGLMMDLPLNPHRQRRAWQEPHGDGTALVKEVMRWGVPAVEVDRLVGLPGFGADLMASWRARLEASPEGVSREATLLEVEHRGRFHVGGGLWPISFAAWPANPMLDQELLKAICGLPLASLAERRAEQGLILDRYRTLAHLPLDRNSWDVQPLAPRLRWMLWDAVSRRLGRAHIRPRPGPERRYYYRQADFNGPVWRAIREEAERGRGVASTILDGVTLDRVLPPPSVDVVWANPFAEGAGARALVGFLLWAQEYLA